MQIFRFFCISSFWNSTETRHFSLLTILSSAEWMFACAFHDYNFRRIILPSQSVSRKETFPMFAMQIGLYSKLNLFFLNHFIWNFLTNSPQPFADGDTLYTQKISVNDYRFRLLYAVQIFWMLPQLKRRKFRLMRKAWNAFTEVRNHCIASQKRLIVEKGNCWKCIW